MNSEKKRRKLHQYRPINRDTIVGAWQTEKNTSRDMAETFLHLAKTWSGPPMFGPDHASKVVGWKLTPMRRMTKFGRVDTCGCIYRGSASNSDALQQGGGAQALPKLWSSLLFMYTPFDAELPNLKWLHIWKRGLFLDVQPILHPRAWSQRSPILEVLFYLSVHPLSQNCQIWRGMGGYLGSATPPIPREWSFRAVQFCQFSYIYAYIL